MQIKLNAKFTKWFAVSTVAVAVVALAGCGSPQAAVVASYNGGTVTTAQMNTQVNLLQLLYPTLKANATVKTEILKEYIVYDRLLLAKAKQAGVTVPQSQVNSTVLQWKQNETAQVFSGSSSKFDAKLQALGLTNADLVNMAQTQLVLQAYSKQLVKTVPLSEQTQYYNKNQAQFATISERHILVKSLPLAQRLATELRQGGSWKTLAKQYSLDGGSKNNGGEYDNQNPTQWVLPFQQHAMTQPIGQIGDPFNSTYGYFVMQVLKRNIAPFNQVKSTVIAQLTQTQQSQAVSALASQLQKSANIKITLPSS